MFTVNYSAFQAATSCRGKNDTRHYCNAIHLDSAGFIVATDGSILFCGKAESKSEESITVDVLGKGPSRFDYVEINTTEAKFYSDKTGLAATLPVRFVDCRYPDWRRATRFSEGSVDAISLQGAYLQTVVKACKFYNKKAAKLEFQSAHDAVRIPLSDSDFIVLMPVRIK